MQGVFSKSSVFFQKKSLKREKRENSLLKTVSSFDKTMQIQEYYLAAGLAISARGSKSSAQ